MYSKLSKRHFLKPMYVGESCSRDVLLNAGPVSFP